MDGSQHRRVLVLATFLSAGISWSSAQAQTPTVTLETIHSFNGKNGAYPASQLVKGPDRRLYSVAAGGDNANGLVFSISRQGDFSVLARFHGGPDGGQPNGPCVHLGTLFGTNASGGVNGQGTAFALNVEGGALQIIHQFNGLDGAQPGPVTCLADGTIVGTTGIGGQFSRGNVFSMTSTGVVTDLYDFTDGEDESYPIGFIVATDGNYYGTTLGLSEFGGGSGEAGTVWQLTPSGVFTTLHAFAWTDGAQPLAPPTEGSDGNFYGTTSNGGPGAGVIYRITPTGDYSILYAFTGDDDGAYPRAALTAAKDGNLYGSTSSGGSSGCGTLFGITLSGTLTTLYTFTGGLDGFQVAGPLVETKAGTFFGTVEGGGAHGFGTVFKLIVR